MDNGRTAGGAPAPGRGGITPVPRETLHDRVYAELRRSLVHGVFVSGEMLRIQDLAEKLRTSTMPVREALARLVSEQALEALPNRSVRVPVITREKLEDLARARVLIEGEVTSRALAHLGKDDFARLRVLTHECEAAFRAAERRQHPPGHGAEPRLPRSHLQGCGLPGPPADDREPVAAVGPLRSRRGLPA